MMKENEMDGKREKNGRFSKGHKNPGQGRPKGSPNKLTNTFKTVVLDEINRLGPEHLHKWALENPGDFYKVAARLIPQSREISGPDGGPIERHDVREYTSEELYAILEGID